MLGEDKAEDRLRELLRDPRWSLPERPDPQPRIRRAAQRQRLRLTGVAAAVAVIAVAVPVGIGASGRVSGPAAHHRATAPVIYAAYNNKSLAAVIPVDTATNKAGKPVRAGLGLQVAITPDGKTAYVLNGGAFTVTPVSTATNTVGRPIHLPRSSFEPSFIAITPDGKTAYVACQHAVVPISTATNTAGKPIPVGFSPTAIAITPDGKTAYVVGTPNNGFGLRGTVTPIDTATDKAGKPIRVGPGAFQIAITPDGKTAYAYGGSAVTPIRTATNTAGTPISLHGNFDGGDIAITPDGKTLYVRTINPDTVVPISTATNTASAPIKVHLSAGGLPDMPAVTAIQFVITPDGKTLYLATGGDSVVAISTATNTATTIRFRSGCRVQPRTGIAITPDSKTAYVTCQNEIIPISTATNTPGKPIPIPLKDPDAIAITP